MQVEQPIVGYNGKPEIDDGHTKIANELLDAIISHDFSKRQLKILLYVMRKTYGWNKPEDDISRSQILEATGMHNPHITKTIQELQEMNVLIVSQGNHAKRYKINKYYDTWRVTETVIVTKSVPVTKTVIVTETVTENYQNSNITLLKQSPQKTLPKDNTKDSCLEVLNYLNEKANKSFRTVKANMDLIKARLKEYSVDDLKLVIDIKTAQWLTDGKMNTYLRPSTLFNATNCAQYISDTPIQQKVPDWARDAI